MGLFRSLSHSRVSRMAVFLLGLLLPAACGFSEQISARAGISAAEAERRVDGEVDLENAAAAQLRQAADAARKSASMAGFCIAISMLTGAFIASAAAALGGAGRDKAA